MKIILTLFSLIALISLISAAPFIKITFDGNNLTVKGYIFYEGFGEYPAPVINDFSESIANCSTVTINNSSYSNCSISNYTKSVYINNNNNSISVMTDTTQQQLVQCLNDKAAFNAGLNSCVQSKTDNNNYKENYTTCAANLIVANGNTDLEKTKRADAEKKYNDSSNQKWIYGIIGLILGIVGLLAYRGELFGKKVQTPEDKFNRQQSG